MKKFFKNIPYYVLILFLVIIFEGCITQDHTSTPPQADYVTGPNSIFKIYNNKADWENNLNPVISTVADANGKVIISGLTVNKDYYYDRYTPDFTYTNWYREDSTDERSFKYKFPISISKQSPDNRQLQAVFLGTGTQSLWKLVDIRDGSSSVWSSKNNCEKDIAIIINKNFSSKVYRGKNIINCSDTATIQFKFWNHSDNLELRKPGDKTLKGLILIDIIDEKVGNTTIKRLSVVSDEYFGTYRGIFAKQ